MEDMLVLDGEQECRTAIAEPPARPRLRTRLWRLLVRVACGFASLVEWLFGLLSLVVLLSTLAALPVVRLLTLGYFLESAASVARSGRLRDGFVGVRKAARVGGIAAGMWVSLLLAWVAGLYARSAALINPGGGTAIFWRAAVVGLTLLAGGRYRG